MAPKAGTIFSIFLFAAAVFFMSISGNAAADHRPCRPDEYYVSLGQNRFCIPSQLRESASGSIILPIEDRSIQSDATYRIFQTNSRPIPVSFIYLDLENNKIAHGSKLGSLSGISLSIEVDKGNTYLSYLKQRAITDNASEWRFEGKHADGRLAEFSHYLSNTKQPVQSVYFATEKGSQPATARYAFLCSLDVRRKETGARSRFINSSCRSTKIPLTNGLIADIRFNADALDLEKWVGWRDSMQALVETMIVKN